MIYSRSNFSTSLSIRERKLYPTKHCPRKPCSPLLSTAYVVVGPYIYSCEFYMIVWVYMYMDVCRGVEEEEGAVFGVWGISNGENSFIIIKQGMRKSRVVNLSDNILYETFSFHVMYVPIPLPLPLLLLLLLLLLGCLLSTLCSIIFFVFFPFRIYLFGYFFAVCVFHVPCPAFKPKHNIYFILFRYISQHI